MSLPRSMPSNLTSPMSRLAQASVEQDIENLSNRGEEAAVASDDEDDSDSSTVRGDGPNAYSMVGSYRRPSFVAAGARSTVVPSAVYPTNNYLTKDERRAVRNEERSLLRDNKIIPPKHPRRSSSSPALIPQILRRISVPSLSRAAKPDDEVVEHGTDAEIQPAPTEASPLLGGGSSLPYGGQDTAENIDREWEKAVLAGKIQTTWQRELKVLLRYSGPLIVTSVLQYSLPVASMFTVGHLGKVELASATIGGMTASITGYAVFIGLATSLDTLCAQAYGSGKKKLVGLQMQRMIYFLWVIMIPISVIWLFGTQILEAILPDKEVARLAGTYLKILLIGLPSCAAFEAGKRFVQAQGLFSAATYCLVICAPLNAFLHWLFVWHFKWGFVGAPIAVVITENLLPLILFLYVFFIDGRQCWGGFSKAALRNWGPMIKLALPGLVMVLAEWMAFELMTLSSGWLGTTHLAAQSVLNTMAAMIFQVPFSMSVAASTRIANLIGATLEPAAKTSAKVALVLGSVVGIINMIILSAGRNWLPTLMCNDADVIRLAAAVLPICAAFQLFDSFAAHCNGILRGLGRQEIGGYVNVFCYYAFALPIGFSLAFGLHWGLHGLWTGAALGLGSVSFIEAWFIYRTDWGRAVEDAKLRNTQG